MSVLKVQLVVLLFQEVSIIYSLSNEPWMKYNMAAVADRGLKPSQWTSARLASQVLLLETLRYARLATLVLLETLRYAPPSCICLKHSYQSMLTAMRPAAVLTAVHNVPVSHVSGSAVSLMI